MAKTGGVYDKGTKSVLTTLLSLLFIWSHMYKLIDKHKSLTSLKSIIRIRPL